MSPASGGGWLSFLVGSGVGLGVGVDLSSSMETISMSPASGCCVAEPLKSQYMTPAVINAMNPTMLVMVAITSFIVFFVILDFIKETLKN
jgi:hypothetical protein